MAKWYVIKTEWGLYCSDFPPFNNFDEACQVCEDHQHLGVVSAPVFNALENLPQSPTYNWEEDPCQLKKGP